MIKKKPGAQKQVKEVYREDKTIYTKFIWKIELYSHVIFISVIVISLRIS